jgi:thioredoxin 1
MPMTEINSMETIRQGNVLLDFYTTTCGPCRALNPVLEEIANEHKSLKVCKVDVTKNFELSQQFGVMSVPTLVFLMDSKVQEISQGNPGREALKSMVRKHVLAKV